MVILMNQYDNPEFFAEYAKMSRSQYGLEGAGEWHQLEPMFPELSGKAVLDLGCGYGWHCKYASDHGAASVLGIDQSVIVAGLTPAMELRSFFLMSLSMSNFQSFL